MNSSKLGICYHDGEIIIKQGSSSSCMYVIQEGRVEIIDENEGNEIKLAELGESEFFGEMGLFEKESRSCTVRAIGETKILTIDKRNLYKSIQEDPTLAYRLLEKMSNRLRQTNMKLRGI